MEYNIYCDESCHLEHDDSNIMVIGGIRCPKNYRRYVNNQIYGIKERFGINPMAEIKWNKVSNCNVNYFKALVDFFFDCDFLEFRAVVVNKHDIRPAEFGNTYNDFYYMICFYCLHGLIRPRDVNYIYLDKKDSRGTSRIQKLHQVLSNKNHDFDQSYIKRIQCVDSKEIPILQLADIIIGAIGYHNRELPHINEAKVELVKYIQQRSGYSLEKSTFLAENKLNLFFIELQK